VNIVSTATSGKEPCYLRQGTLGGVFPGEAGREPHGTLCLP
jgi:hypothetical protein